MKVIDKIEDAIVHKSISHKMCECGGEYKLNQDGYVLLSYPCKYEHQCNKCGNIEYFTEIFPKVYMRAQGE